MWVEVSTGRIHGGIGSQPVMGPHLQKGTIRPIAVPTPRRPPKLRDVPTCAEQGFNEPVFKIAGWIVLLGPAGLPRDITQRLAKLAIAAAEKARIREIHSTFGILDNPSTREEFERRYRDDDQVWLSIVRELGVTLDLARRPP